MAQVNIDPGAAPNDGTGDDLRDAWIAAEANFTELYLRWSDNGSSLKCLRDYIIIEATLEAGIKLQNTNIDKWQLDNIAADNSFRIRSLGTAGDRVRILQSGFVGINTTTPGSRLAVFGLPVYADNAAALVGGLLDGDFYKTAATGDAIVMVTNAT